jgi:surfeit locus 1 family protein
MQKPSFPAKRRFQPKLWPTLITIPAVLFMLALCLWQVQRMYWKEGVIAERTGRSEAAPIALPPMGADIAAAEFHRVTLSGRFDHGREFYLAARSQNGNVGYWVVTPLVLSDGAGAVLVNRGWVPTEKKLPEARPEGQITGDVSFDGIIRQPQHQSWFQPDNEPQKNTWFYLDPAEIAASSGLPVRQDLYFDAVKSDIPGTYPLGGQTRISIPNDHLQYAITWGALAAALVVIYVISSMSAGASAAPPQKGREDA